MSLYLILKYKQIVFIFFVCVVYTIMPQFVTAGGKVVVKPFLKPGWRYDSNYYKSAKDERAVSTYSVKPGITVGYETPKSKLALNAALDFQSYHDEDDVPAGEFGTDEDNYTEQTVLFNSESQLFDRLSIGIGEQYMKTRDPVSADAYSNATERKKYTMNTLSPKMVYKFGEKFGIYSVYTNRYMDYSDSNSEDSTENRGKLDLFYNLNKRLSFDIDYQVWSRDYDMTTSDYTSNQFMLNMTRKYKYFSTTGGAGYQDRSFDKDSLDNINALAWKFTLNGRSNGEDETESGEQSRSRMMLSLSQNLNDFGEGEEYYTATRLDARFSRLFMEKLDVSIKGYMQNSDYEFSDREDDTWSLSASLEYMMKDWLKFGCESGYESRDSNWADKDYDGFYALINVEFNYNLGSR